MALVSERYDQPIDRNRRFVDFSLQIHFHANFCAKSLFYEYGNRNNMCQEFCHHRFQIGSMPISIDQSINIDQFIDFTKKSNNMWFHRFLGSRNSLVILSELSDRSISIYQCLIC
jgi:hypothetical protein